MLTPKIYDWHLKWNWHDLKMVTEIVKAQYDLAPLPPCECGCNVGIAEGKNYFCMMCKKSIIIELGTALALPAEVQNSSQSENMRSATGASGFTPE